MTKEEAYRECKRRNQKRDVKEYSAGSVRASRFWANCSLDSNSLIAGGAESQRTDMLVQMLKNIRSRSREAVVLLTTSPVTENAVKQAAINRELGAVVISSPRARNYCPLRGMDPTRILNLFMAVAGRRNFEEQDKLEGYIRAFLQVAAKYHALSLNSLRALERQYPSAEVLGRLAQKAGMAAHDIEAIVSYPNGAHTLRRIMGHLADACHNIAGAPNQTVRNMLAAVKEGQLICVNIMSTEPDIMDLALAAELEQIAVSGVPFTLVMNDVPMIAPEGMARRLRLLQNVYSWVHLAICVQNASSWANTVSDSRESGDRLLMNMQNIALFHNSNETDSDTEGVLKLLGKYNRHEVTVGGGHPPAHFHIPWVDKATGAWTVSPVGLRDRVTPEDMTGYSVLLKGHKGRIIELYKSIVF